ncbi:uncharacterized protein EV154DRAFT_555840 [Mucor mucedo]|uniref:uncharacterized protein n=1 Tax=Mucor mucedo TaxID=29922 RepID=UPI00221FAC5B|nr:uncharacterized protein EV154DRAFT_555840 [Mucor mucedo]KAI7875746.1 hypothetical protein EV154DRAFT_555840 [Mucor mucedo]
MALRLDLGEDDVTTNTSAGHCLDGFEAWLWDGGHSINPELLRAFSASLRLWNYEGIFKKEQDLGEDDVTTNTSAGHCLDGFEAWLWDGGHSINPELLRAFSASLRLWNYEGIFKKEQDLGEDDVTTNTSAGHCLDGFEAWLWDGGHSINPELLRAFSASLRLWNYEGIFKKEQDLGEDDVTTNTSAGHCLDGFEAWLWDGGHSINPELLRAFSASLRLWNYEGIFKKEQDLGEDDVTTNTSAGHCLDGFEAWLWDGGHSINPELLRAFSASLRLWNYEGIFKKEQDLGEDDVTTNTSAGHCLDGFEAWLWDGGHSINPELLRAFSASLRLWNYEGIFKKEQDLGEDDVTTNTSAGHCLDGFEAWLWDGGHSINPELLCAFSASLVSAISMLFQVLVYNVLTLYFTFTAIYSYLDLNWARV